MFVIFMYIWSNGLFLMKIACYDYYVLSFRTSAVLNISLKITYYTSIKRELSVLFYGTANQDILGTKEMPYPQILVHLWNIMVPKCGQNDTTHPTYNESKWVVHPYIFPVNIFFLIQETPMNKKIPMTESCGGDAHGPPIALE